MIDFGLGVALCPLYRDGLTYLRNCRNDPKIWRWTRQNDLISEVQQEEWFEKQARDPSVRMYQVVSVNPPSMVGVCGLTSINLLNRNAEFSLYICPQDQKKGLAKPALKTLFYHGFKNMGLNTIWGETFENNPAQKIFVDLGMTRDGRKRQCYYKDGAFWDALIFTITYNEFISKHEDRSCFS